MRAVLVLTLLATSLGCREPTEAVLDITTDGVCADVGGTGISVGQIGVVETKKPDITTTRCEGNGDIGSMVLLPPEDGEDDAPFAFKVVTSLDGAVDKCTPPAYGPQCIVARRSMRFVPHHAYHVPLRMSQACAGVICPERQSCVDGTCRTTTLDPAKCDDSLPCEPPPGPVAPWEKPLGGLGQQMARHLKTAGDGTLVVTGLFNGPINLGGGQVTAKGGFDVFLATYSPGGLYRWSATFGDVGVDAEGDSVAIDARSDIYLAAHFNKTVDFGGGPLTSAGASDIALVKFSSVGKFRWSLRLGGAFGDVPGRVATDAQRNVYVVGQFSASSDFGTTTLKGVGGTDAFVASFTPEGNLRWAKALGGPGLDGATSVGTDANGNVYVGGYVEAQADVGGPMPLQVVGTGDGFIASYDTNGGFRWAKSFGAPANDLVSDLEVRDDRVVAVGSFSNAATIDGTPVPVTGGGGFVASFDTGGKLVWAQGFAGAGNSGEAVDIAKDGSLVVGGEITGGSVFGSAPIGPTAMLGSQSPFVAVLEPDGTPRWARSYASSMMAYGYVFGVGAAPGGLAYLAGWYTGTLTIDDQKTTTSQGLEDAFLWRAAPP